MIMTNFFKLNLLVSFIGISLGGEPAKFEEKFKVETVRRGGNAMLKCDVIGDQPISIVWYKDETELEVTKLSRYEKFETIQTNGKNSWIFIQNVDHLDGALYSCNATNDYGDAERSIKVVVVEVPAQPIKVDALNLFSRSAGISWSAPYTGNSPITKYKIQYWEEKLGRQRLYEDEISADKTTTYVRYLLPGISYELAVVAENEIGYGNPSETIRFATTDEEPCLPPIDIYLEATGTTSILVKWKPPPIECWNGEMVGYYVGYKRDGGQSPYTFRNINTSTNESNKYLIRSLIKSTCYRIVIKAYNKAGTGPPTQDLLIRTLDADPLKWLEQPTDVITVIGATINVHCNASGSPEPLIYWIKYSGGNVSPLIHSNSPYSSINETYLIIPRLSYEDAGTYACIADNWIQPRIKTNFSINFRASFEEKFVLIYVKSGETARLKCEAFGNQPLSVTWQREETMINKSGDERHDIIETLTPKTLMSELIIQRVNWDDNILFTCIAENEFGNDQRLIRVIVMEVPAPPMDIKIQEIWSRSARVSWSLLKDGNYSITKYIIQYWKNVVNVQYRNVEEISVPSLQSSVLLKELLPYAPYVLKVFAENAVGRSDASDDFSFRTGEDIPQDSALDIEVEPIGSSIVRVSWRPPPKSGWNGELKGFYVGFKVQNSNRLYSYISVEYLPEVKQELVLTNLFNSTDYIIVIQAFNSVRSGPKSQEIYVKTLEGDLFPGPPLYVLNTTSTSISLSWNTSNIDNSLSTYIVHYREDDGRWKEVAVIAPEDSTYTLTNLKSQKLYQIYVRVINKYGIGDPSETIEIKTN